MQKCHGLKQGVNKLSDSLITSTDHLPLCLILTLLNRPCHLITGVLSSVLLKEKAKFPQVCLGTAPDLVFPGLSKSNTLCALLSVSHITLFQREKSSMDCY